MALPLRHHLGGKGQPWVGPHHCCGPGATRLCNTGAADCLGKANWGCLKIGATEGVWDRYGVTSEDQALTLTSTQGPETASSRKGNPEASLGHEKAPGHMGDLVWSGSIAHW